MDQVFPVWVDINAGAQDYSTGAYGIFLNKRGTQMSLAQQGIELREGMILQMYSSDGDEQGHTDDLVFEGTLTWTDWHGGCWMASVSRSCLRNLSEVRHDPDHGASKVDWGALHRLERTG